MRDITPYWKFLPFSEAVISLDDEGLTERVGGLGGHKATQVNDSVDRTDKALDQDGNVISDVINDRLDSQTALIKAEWEFSEQGAFVVKEDNDNGLWFSPNGILAKNDGNTTFAIDNEGNATFAGELAVGVSITSPEITGGTITGGTITGGTLQTATTGLRIKLSSIPQNEIEFLKDDTKIGSMIVAESGDDRYLNISGGLGSLEIMYGVGASPGWSSSLDSGGNRVFMGGAHNMGWVGLNLANPGSGDDARLALSWFGNDWGTRLLEITEIDVAIYEDLYIQGNLVVDGDVEINGETDFMDDVYMNNNSIIGALVVGATTVAAGSVILNGELVKVDGDGYLYV